MGNRLSSFANIDDRIAKPGDPDLDAHVTGLRIAGLVILPEADDLTEWVITFDTSEVGGWWLDESGDRFYPDAVTSFELAAGLSPSDVFGRRLLDVMLGRLKAWHADGALIAMTGAPGKWTLLHSPLHPAGAEAIIPRGMLQGEASDG